MKNVYLYIAVWLIGLGCYGQNLQNANWYFGNHAGLTFLPSPATPAPLSGSIMNVDEGCASVSDSAGNLLFYTNGITVLDQNHTPMLGVGSNSLFGDGSSTQNAIIVPKPGDPGNYYIVTINGQTGSAANPKGVYYSEVDMSLNGGYGDIVPGKKNLVLSNTSTVSEKLTSTIHSNGTDYWVITQIGNNIYSYLVTSAGIGPTPILSPAIHDITNSYGVGQLKVSPNTQRIAVTYSEPLVHIGYVAIGTFNNSTGLASFGTGMTNLITINDGVYGVEFSPQSQNIYITGNGKIFYTTGPGSTLFNYSFTTTGGINYFVGIQRAINGRIYAIRAGFQNNLWEITTPDNLANPGFQPNFTAVSGTLVSGLPQWVWKHEETCQPLTLTYESNTIYTYHHKSTILAHDNYNVTSGKDITMKARDFIVLGQDAHIASGANYWAKIEDCENGGIEMRKAAAENTSGKATGSIDKKLTLYPNPANSFVTVTSGDGINNISITSLDGKLMYRRDYSAKETSTEVDIQNYTEGIYMISITTAKGEVQTGKLIKN